MSSGIPRAWAEQFKLSGARHVVFVAKYMPTDIASGRQTFPIPTELAGTLSQRIVWSGNSARPYGVQECALALYYCGGMDWTFNQRPVGSMSDVIASIPRGDYPAYADAQVRELIDRYQPSVLWNDVARPSGAKRLWPLLDHYYRQVPDGVLNDRWIPWSPLLSPSVGMTWGVASSIRTPRASK